MKVKLFKTLAIGCASLVLGVAALTGCGGTKARKAYISELTAWDTETNAPVSDGEYVRITDVVITAQYSEWEYCVQNIPATNTSALTPIEVHFTAVEDWIFDVKDILHVTGYVSHKDGHAIIKDATAVWGTGGQAVCDGTGPLYYYADWTRGQWDYNVSRTWSGVYFELTLQIAALPEELVAGEESSITVVFPGEDLDLENENNWFYMDLILPGYTETQLEVVNPWFETLAVGDCVYFFFQAYYNGLINGILPYTSFRLSGTNQKTIPDGVYQTWGNAETVNTAAHRVFDSFTTIWPDLSSDEVYSYVASEGYTDQDTGLPVVVVTAYTYEPLAYLEEMLTFILGTDENPSIYEPLEDGSNIGWALGQNVNDVTKDPIVIAQAQYLENPEDPEGDLVLTAVGAYFVMWYDDASISLEFYSTEETVRGETAVADANANIPAVEKHVKDYYGYYDLMEVEDPTTWTSSVVAPTIDSSYLLGATYNTSYSRAYGTTSGVYVYDITWYLNDETLPEGTTAKTIQTAWLTALAGETGGFAADETTVLAGLTGNTKAVACLYNATTNVVLMPYAQVGDAEKETISYVGAYLVYVAPSVAPDYIESLAEEAEATRVL